MRNPKLVLDPMDLSVDVFDPTPSIPGPLFDPAQPPPESGYVTCGLTCFRSCVC